MEQEKDSVNPKVRRPMVYIRGIVILSLVFLIVYFGYTKIMSHSKKENMLKVATKVNKKEEASKKTEQQPKQPEQTVKAAEQPVEGPPQDINENAELDQYLQSKGFSGTAVVVKNGKVLLNKGYGLANQEKKIPNNSETTFYIGSISKAFVATAIMQLKDQNKLQTEDIVTKYIPGFPHGEGLKLSHLLTHTSGIPEYEAGSEDISHEELLKRIGEQKRLANPGGKWEYSDSNYSILAYIVEKVSGQPLEEYIKQHIFDVIGMKNSGFGRALEQTRYPSTGYKIVNNNMTTPAIPSMSQLYGCGDIYTSAYDLYLFNEGLFSGKLISEESYNEMFTPVRKNYGFGWYVNPGSYSNHGVMPGWNCLNGFSKSGNIHVVLLSNIQNNIKSFGKVNNDMYTMLQHIEV
ncbi:serine hydrolase domain-containing protein [Bacillus cytotoxicus]|uniref:serine hydrolase domain-containing protein n=1 Tax=Bacillus cereus group TaxID=86661 RepID=UPI0006616C28|nr:MULTISPECIES: serine hydrolase domain-containing protein [Bacillus cereus group]AWC59708.1 penicillin-binding protein [Bacillus cytotoxicus]KMT48520.1 penicillin-binding protein [Bacillus cytotoxicus]MDH2889345.1 beta-lactamase family protein [Bacillus cytotoxicus]QTR80452.1 beta-lactamase family protein [Bacillus cytotoxicus]HDR7309479.1 beta-lactamase family protein [Bacillus cytotoxicus]